jgi:hypothetical protein
LIETNTFTDSNEILTTTNYITALRYVYACLDNMLYVPGYFISRQRPQISLGSKAPRPNMGLTQPFIKWTQEELSLGAKRTRAEAKQYAY